MKSAFKLSAIALAVAGSLNAQASDDFATDPLLYPVLSGLELKSLFTLELEYTVANASLTEVDGPVRAVVEAAVRPRNAVGKTRDGRWIVEICDACALPAYAGTETFTVDMPLFRFLARPLLDVEVEYVPYTLQLLHNADMDGNGNLALENVANFSGLLESFRAEMPEQTLVLSSGDNYIPGPRYNAAAEVEFTDLLGVPGVGRLDMAFMNAMGYQASAVGNHDLDGGTAEFAAIYGADGAYPGAAFPYLSANLDFTTDAALVADVVPDGQDVDAIDGKLAGYATVEVDGETIGLVGAVTPTLDQITNTGDITITPMIVDSTVDVPALAGAIQPAVDALTSQGIDKVILLAHMQRISIEQELATLLRGVDIIVAGGSNTRLLDATDRLYPGDDVQGEYPGVFDSAAGEPVVVVNTDGDYKYLGRLVSRFTLGGTIDLDSLDPEVNGGYATDAESWDAFGAPAPNETVVALADTAQAVLERINIPVGQTDVFINGNRAPGVRTEETNLGNLTADANLVAAQAVDPTVVVSIKNGGGIRASIGSLIVPPGGTEAVPEPPADGIITRLAVEQSLAFNNGLTVLDLTGAELRAVLEHGIGLIPDVSGRFPQVSGVTFSYDATLPAGSRIVTASVGDTPLVVDGATVAPDAVFPTVTLNFLAGGGDGYPFPCDDPDGTGTCVNQTQLAQPEDAPRTGLFDFAEDGSEQDALAEYLGANFPADDDPATPAFSEADTAADDDTRIVRLD